MPKRSSKKRPRDLNRLAESVVDDTASDEPDEEEQPEKNHAAVELGRLGGKKGGPTRTKKLTAEQREDIAQKAARAG